MHIGHSFLHELERCGKLSVFVLSFKQTAEILSVFLSVLHYFPNIIIILIGVVKIFIFIHYK